MAIALVAALAITGTVFAAITISNTWQSPTVTVTVQPQPLLITSSLDGGGNLAKYTGVETPFTVTIHNTAAVAYTGVTTITSISKVGGGIALGDITIYDEWPIGTTPTTWRDLTPYITLSGGSLVLPTSTHDFTAHGGAYDTDITNLKVIFNTVGTYQATAYSTNP
jgi:hypothetical protein